MNAPLLVSRQCALCGTCIEPSPTIQDPPASSVDLDTRGTVGGEHLRIEYCGGCGFCSDDLTNGSLIEQAVVHSSRYQLQRNHSDYPRQANQYLCMDLLAQVTWQWKRASWACIQAAWACDDQGLVAQARQCRLWAINRIGQTRVAGELLTAQPGSSLLLQLDLLRRAQRFDSAHRLLQREERSAQASMLSRIRDYQTYLISQQDDRRHSLQDMERWERQGSQSRFGTVTA